MARVGSRAVMVRLERGKRREVEYEVVEYEPNHRVAYTHLVPGVTFNLSIDIEPVTVASCDLRVRLAMKLSGASRLLEPIIALGMPKTGNRIMDGMQHVAETEPAIAV